MDAPKVRLELYAELCAAIAAGRPEEELLAEHGLSERDFTEIEAEVEGALSAAMDQDDAAPFLIEYDRALREAHARASGPALLSFADYSRAVAVLCSGQDPLKALEAAGFTPAEVARATQHHAGQLARDPERVEELERARTNPQKKKP